MKELKSMKKNIFSRLAIFMLLLIMAVFPMSACDIGGEDEDNDPDLLARPIQITIGVQDNSSELSIIRSFIKPFVNSQEEINVVIQRMAGNVDTVMKNYINTNSMPDMVWTGSDLHSKYSGNGYFEDLSVWDANDDTFSFTDLQDKSVESAKIKPTESGIYFMPRDYNKVVVFYNKDAFDSAGLTYPTNDWEWDDFLEVCKTLREKMDADTDPRNGLSRASFPVDAELTWSPVHDGIMQSYGAKWANEDQTAGFDSDEARAAFTSMRDLVQNKYAVDPNLKQAGTNLFAARQAAMWFSVRPNLQVCLSKNINVDFVAFPKIGDDPKVTAGCSGYAMSSTSKNKEACWEFLKFVVSEEGQESFGNTQNAVPVLKALQNKGTWMETEGLNGVKLNHSAFTEFSDRDINGNYLSNLPYDKHVEANEIFGTVVGDVVGKEFDSTTNLDSIIAKHLQTYKDKVYNY